MGRPSAVYLRCTADELNEWLMEAQDRLRIGSCRRHQLWELMDSASRALRQAADLVESAPARREERERRKVSGA